jgi:hypothetical protein
MRETIYQPMTWAVPVGAPEVVRLQNEMGRKAIRAETFDNRFEDKVHARIKHYRHAYQNELQFVWPSGRRENAFASAESCVRLAATVPLWTISRIPRPLRC